jgi:hypothetical protein
MGNIEVRAILTFFLLVAAIQSSAQDGLIAGRMSCSVTGSQYVASNKAQLDELTNRRVDFASGASLIFEYTLDEVGRLEVLFSEDNRKVVIFREPFSPQDFKGLTPFVGVVEFEKNYRELSLGHYGINFSGTDQLYLRRCSNNDWAGYYVKTYFGDHFTQVTNLNCRVEVDTVDEVLARLKVVQ